MNAFGRASLAFGILVLEMLLAKPDIAQNSLARPSVRFGLSTSVVEPEVNPTDALAAAKIWADLLGKGTGLWDKAEASLFFDTASLISSVNQGNVDIFAITTNEFLEMENDLRAVPTLAYVTAGSVQSQYLILVRKDSGINTIADLRNKRISTPKGGRYTMAPIWLDALFYDRNLPEKEKYFSEIKHVLKANQSILPIFFKQMDAGIALRSTFETAVTLNPQIGHQLKVLEASPELVASVTCMRATLSMALRNEYINQALKLHELPNVLQSFQLFKIDRMVKWDPSFAINVRDLLTKKKSAQAASALPAKSNYRVAAGK